MTNATPLAPELEMQRAGQSENLKTEILSLAPSPWRRWPESVAVVLLLCALARIAPAIALNAVDIALLYLAALAPLLVLGYKYNRLERRVELLTRAMDIRA